jgi:hypothetical protein
MTPALLKTRSAGPQVCSTVAAAASIDAWSVTSTVSASAVPPAARISATSFSSMSPRRASTATLAPREASSLAVARPMPLEAPVTTAIRLFSWVMIVLLEMPVSETEL